MVLRAKIYRPVKTAMQSGKARTKFWVLEFTKSNSNKDFVMGWTSSSNTGEQVKLKFETQEQAIACLLYTSPSPRDRQKSRMPSSA